MQRVKDPALSLLWLEFDPCLGISTCRGWSKKNNQNKGRKEKAEQITTDKFKIIFRVPTIAQRLTNPTSIHENLGSIPGLAQWVEDPALP